MKRLFIALAMAVTLGTSVMAQKSLYRHNPQVVSAANTVDTSEIVAYSDTTGAAPDTVAYAGTHDNDAVPDSDKIFNNVSDPFQLIAYLADLGGIGGVLIAIFFVLLCLLVVLSPFILVGLILYFGLRSRNQKYKLVEKAIEKGQPIPQELLRSAGMSNEILWRKGIQNICVGLGLAVFFYILGAGPLAGIGWLVFFCGVGQAVIARTSAGRRSKREYDDFVDDARDGFPGDKEK